MVSATRDGVTGRTAGRRTGRLPRHVRVLLRLSGRRLPEPVCSVTVERGIEVPASDGVAMLTDHYRPQTEAPCPTLLVRTPYGRGFPWDYVYGALFAHSPASSYPASRALPFCVPRRAVAEAGRVPPTSLLTGWTDVCLDPTLAAYRRLRDAGREVRLIVGPWNHASGFNDDMPVLLDEALLWLRSHLNGESGDSLPPHPVRVHVSEIGTTGEWRDLPDWPPPWRREQLWHLHGDGTLAAEPPAGADVSSVRYDPAAPTPSVGGPRMDSRNAGPRRNNKLAARPDVLVLTSAPLAEPVDVIGPVSIKLRVRGSSPHFDVFARLCDVDSRGTSWNICDGLLRLGGNSDGPAEGAGSWSDITVPMSGRANGSGLGWSGAGRRRSPRTRRVLWRA